MPREKIENTVCSLIAEFLELKDESEAEASMDQVPKEAGSEVAANKVCCTQLMELTPHPCNLTPCVFI